jgi:Protein of unknown function (DUF3667)
MFAKDTESKKQCKNCDAYVAAEYCSVCGQKIHFESEPTVHEFLHEIIHEFLHLDGKIFKTLWVLFTQPGQLTKELLRGRRASYVGPIRIYLAISLGIFLLDTTFQPNSHIEPQKSQAEIEGSMSASNQVFSWIVSEKQVQKINQFNKDHPGQLQEFASHSNAKIFFILVPLVALLLQWSFGKRRRNYISYLYCSLYLSRFFNRQIFWNSNTHNCRTKLVFGRFCV